jgi:hypothetical protein
MNMQCVISAYPGIFSGQLAHILFPSSFVNFFKSTSTLLIFGGIFFKISNQYLTA